MTMNTKSGAMNIFDEAKMRLMTYFFTDRNLRSLLYLMIDELASAQLGTSHTCWQELFAELSAEDFAEVIKILDQVFGGRGVQFELAVMPGAGANAPAISCLSITVSSMKRAILLPLNEESVRLCKLSAPFLGSNFWMEPIYNENPDLTFRRAVGMLSVEPLVCPPPMSGCFVAA